MERKLYRGITTPSMVATVVFGVWLISYNVEGYLSQGWMHAKLLLVVLLIGYHFYCGHLVKVFRDDQNTRSHVFYRWFNEMPVLVTGGRCYPGCCQTLLRSPSHQTLHPTPRSDSFRPGSLRRRRHPG